MHRRLDLLGLRQEATTEDCSVVETHTTMGVSPDCAGQRPPRRRFVTLAAQPLRLKMRFDSGDAAA
jgi:hypothetical protein